MDSVPICSLLQAEIVSFMVSICLDIGRIAKHYRWNSLHENYTILITL